MLSCEYRAFSENDDQLIRQHINNSTVQSHQGAIALADEFDTTMAVVFQRAFQIGCVNYSPYSAYLLSHRHNGYRSDEVNTLITHRNLTRKKLASLLDRSLSSINKQMYCFGLMRNSNAYRWSRGEINALRDLAKTSAVSAIAKILNRTAIDVKHRAIEEQVWLHQSGDAFTSRRVDIATPRTIKEHLDNETSVRVSAF